VERPVSVFFVLLFRGHFWIFLIGWTLFASFSGTAVFICFFNGICTAIFSKTRRINRVSRKISFPVLLLSLRRPNYHFIHYYINRICPAPDWQKTATARFIFSLVCADCVLPFAVHANPLLPFDGIQPGVSVHFIDFIAVHSRKKQSLPVPFYGLVSSFLLFSWSKYFHFCRNFSDLPPVI
jgi:hypothetical protein